MNPKRSLLIATASAVGSAAALVASPGTYAWLRRRAGLDTVDRHFELSDFPPAPEPAATGPDPRASLRARLAADAPWTPPAPAPSTEPWSDGPAEAADRLRAAVDETRARAREKAAGALDVGGPTSPTGVDVDDAR